jgi:hypothetical protein
MFDAVGLREDCVKAAGAEVEFASDDELLSGAVDVATARAALDAAECHLLGELEARKVCDRQFGSVTATWLAHVTRGDRRSVSARVKVGAKLRSTLGAVDDALSCGSISFDHARTMVADGNPRVSDQIADEQDDWVARAQDRPFKVWRGELRCRVELLDQDGPFDPNAALARNAMTLTPLGGDGIAFRGELTGPLAAAFKQMVEAKADELFRRFDRDHQDCPELEMPTRKTLLALALAELLQLGWACDRATTPGPVVDLTLMWNAENPDVLEDLDGEFRLAFERYRELWCDPLVTPLTMSIKGVPLDLGRSERFADRAQRRALGHRDGGCVFPGCDAPPTWCDAHHIDSWEHGGPTDLANLALLCRHHHGVTHRHGWAMTATDDQQFFWSTPTGRTLHSQRHHGRPPPGT